MAGASGNGTALASAGQNGAAVAQPIHVAAGSQSTPNNGSAPGAGGGGTVTPDGGGGGGGSSGGGSSGGGTAPPGSTPDPTIGNWSESSLQSFTYFPVYVLDNNNGVVLYPGVVQLATLDGYVDLVAQVSGTTVSSYSWSTSGAPSAGGASSTTNQLTFRWATQNTIAEADAITLSVTDTNSHTETFTYDFWVPSGSSNSQGSGGGTNVSWPTSLAPSQQLLSSPTFSSEYASVDANSGSLDTEIDLPSYNPNVPALALTYDSVTANPEPIVTFENTIGDGANPGERPVDLQWRHAAHHLLLQHINRLIDLE